ncbi:sulfurtransferase complex subunit TusD [Candidatus Profftia tarda]|uniref:Sulfurtransferase TusD n=1 Tax=Candidatus Profftia tarda TaxID=1177216 RepID=A0A8E4EYF4_9ENTR|nr:sulfurtransferase complex subunit TusD [Candidatus Profftia tarda]CAD6510725.1 Sulfurtransferase TusD [Candidatus Profftia tarda]
MISYSLLVTGPAYGTQAASSAYQFAEALIANKHRLLNVFFYREGVSNANNLTSPANNELDLVRAWHILAEENNVVLNVCVAAALRRGVVSLSLANELGLYTFNLQNGFILSGLGSLAEAALKSDRLMQF